MPNSQTITHGGASATLLRGVQHPSDRALRIAISGGIGSGKTVVTSFFERGGAVVAQADIIAREVVAPGTEGFASVVDAFGEQLVLPSGELDRPQLAEIVFQDSNARRRLESLTHPLIAARAEEILATAQPGAIAVYDVPLLVETGITRQFDHILMVDAPLALRMKRLAQHGIDPADALRRINTQATHEERREVATIWLDNAGSMRDLNTVLGRMSLQWLGFTPQQ